jgi:hypothetical protein
MALWRIGARKTPPSRRPVSIPSLENFSKVKAIYMKSDALYVEVVPDTPFEIESNIADQAGQFILSTQKGKKFIQVYVTESDSFCLAAVYDGSAAGKER